MADTALWNKKELGYNKQKHIRHFPIEYMLRSTLSPNYFKNSTNMKKGDKILDIGCLYINNLLPFYDRELDLYGVEVSEDGVNIARECASSQEVSANIQLGTNSNLPFESDFFDIVLSLNTIHYEENTESVLSGLSEISRVLKKGGNLIISTAGQEHDIVKNAMKVTDNNYIVQKTDFRDGERFSFFEDEDDFKSYLSKIFTEVEIAIVTERYPKSNLQFYVAKCIK